jgi:phosphopantetheinyl transferase
LVETELKSFLQDASNKFEFSYEIINIKKFMRDVFSKDENVWSSFSDAEKVYIDKYTNPKKRIQWMAGRYAGKKALKKLTSITDNKSCFGYVDFKQISILNGLNSAPYIEEYPHLNISISHSYPYCIAVVSRHSIGVDIENTISIVEPILKFYYTLNEIKEINKLKTFGDLNKLNYKENECEANCLATLYWTRKEAISKLQKHGMNLNFDEIDTVYDVTKLKGVPIENIRTVSIQNLYCSLSLAFR